MPFYGQFDISEVAVILLVDVGNSAVKSALVDDSDVITLLDSVVYPCPQGTDLKASLTLLWKDVLKVEQVFLANVGRDELADVVIAVAKQLWGASVTLVKVTRSACDVRNRYSVIEQLGVDRWLAVIGARHSHVEQNIIVVDIGTAINVELLSANEYQGGVILPGLSLMHDALVGRAYGISSLIDYPQQIIGKSTRQCVNSGVYFGLAGAIDRVIGEMQQVLSVRAKVILCGGGADVLVDLLKVDVEIDMNLIFRGLLEVAKCES